MKQPKLNSWKTIEKRNIFKNQYIGFRNDKAQRPDGEIVDYAVVEMNDYVTIICENQEGNIVLIHQYRYPWQDDGWEAPSGFIESGEKPEEAAIREVKEESGYEVKNLEYLFRFRPSGVTKAFCYLFFAKVASKGLQSLDPNEFIEVGEFYPQKVDDLIQDEKIIHGSTIIGWLVVKNKNLIKINKI